MNAAKIQRWIETHRRMKWRMAMRIASLPKERGARKAAEWNHPAARASFRELLSQVNVESCGDPYQVTEMWRRGFESAALQCFRQKVRPKKVRKTWISEFSLFQMQQVGSIRRARENMNVRWNSRDGHRARCLDSMRVLTRALRSLDVGVACVTVQLRLLPRSKDKSIKKRPTCQFSVHVTGGQWCRCER